MKYKIGILITAIVLTVSSVAGYSVYAQENNNLAPDPAVNTVPEPTNYEASPRTSGGIMENQDSDFANPEANSTDGPLFPRSQITTRQALTESIDVISRVAEEISRAQDQAILDIKATIKNDIDNSIIEIIKIEPEIQAYELQGAVDAERTELFETVTEVIQSDSIEESTQDTSKFEELKTSINESLSQMGQNLETVSGVSVNFASSQQNVQSTLTTLQETLTEKKRIISSRQGDLVFKDSDNDDISDYDEIYIYKTNPQNAQTVAGSRTDGQKIREGIDPLSATEEKIKYQDPRKDKESSVLDTYGLVKVQLIKEEEEKLIFEGIALPNTHLTLFIYSTPIIVTVKTDNDGVWSYELEEELENGEHQIYMATVDTSGKIIARSNPILFTKSAEAATIGIVGNLNPTFTAQNFLKDNFILIALAALIAVVILGMMFVGNHKNVGSAVANLTNEVNDK